MGPYLLNLIRGLFCAVCLGAVPALAADGALDVPVRESEAADAPVTEKLKLYSASKALVIGIDSYTGSGWLGADRWPKLSKGIEDAVEVAKSLQAKGFKVTLLKDLGSEALKSAMEDFFIREGADPEARLLIWFAGHGHTIGIEGYLVPADAPLPTKDEIEFLRKALSLRRFGEFMRQARAKHVLAVFDSCFAGAIFDVARALPPRAITRATALKVRQFISSGDANQTVSDNGRFRRIFIDALDGKEPAADPNDDGFITGTELGLFLSDKITNLSEKGQTPRYGKLIAEGFDRGDFVLEKGKLDVAAAPPAPKVSDTPGQTPGTAGAPSGKGVSSEGAGTSAAERAWALVQSSEDIAILEGFRRQFGAANPFYDQLASSRIETVKQARAKADETERQRVAALKAEEDRKAEAAAEAKRKADEAAAKQKEEAQRLAMLAVEEKKRAEADLSKSGRVFRDCSECPEMVVVPAGKFTMGADPEFVYMPDERAVPARKVTIAKPFAVGKFEVTFAEWDACLEAGGCDGYRPNDQGWGRGKRPVINVSWDDAKKYVIWLSKKTGETYRLLSEAEWEYALRAGTTTPFTTDNRITTDQANFSSSGEAGEKHRDQTIEVGSFKPNAFGLFDMNGNVFEWAEDCYHANYQGAPMDGAAWVTSCTENKRVGRGGSWHSNVFAQEATFRLGFAASDRDYDTGIRVGRTL